MTLGPTDLVNGIMSTITLSVSLAVVFLIINKYFKFKNKQLLYVAISIFGIIWSYGATVISFLWQLITQYPFLDELYFLIGNVLYPITLPFWIYLTLDLSKIKKAKLYAYLTCIFMTFLDIIFIYLVFTTPELIGNREPGSLVDIRFTGYAVFYALISLFLVWIGLIIFLRDVFKSVSPELKLKGIFILGSLIIFSVVVQFDGFVQLDIPQLIIVRSFVILSSIFAYIGWIMPESLKKFLLKNKS